MSFWSNEWTIAIGSGVVLSVGGLIARRFLRDAPTNTAEAKGKGNVIAVAGTGNTVNVHAAGAEEAAAAFHAKLREREKQLELANTLRANVDRTNDSLRSIVSGIDHWSKFGPALHQNINENRAELLMLRPKLASLHRPDAIEQIERWYESVDSLRDFMSEEMAVWVHRVSMPAGDDPSPDYHVSPAVRHVARYKTTLNVGRGVANIFQEIAEKLVKELRG